MALPFNRSRPGVWLSAGAHGAVLLAAVIGLSSEKLPDAEEGIAVEIVTDNMLSEITKGVETAKPQPDPKPRADRVADTVQEREPGEAPQDAPAPPKRPAEAKVADTDTEAAPAPPARVADAKPEPVKPEPVKPVPVPAPRPEPVREAAKPEPAKVDPAPTPPRRDEAIKLAQREDAAEALAKAEAEKAEARAKAQADARAEADAKVKAAAAAARAEAQLKADAGARAKLKTLADAAAKAEAETQAAKAVADAKAKTEADSKAKALAQAKSKAEAEAKARKQAEAAEKFSPGDISKLLASKAPSQSTGATGREINKTASLGTATGSSQRLNPSQRDQLMGLLRDQLHRCWQAPMGVTSSDRPPVPTIRVRLKEDGSLAAEPAVTNPSNDALFRTVADSATRATRRCAPLKIPAQFAPFYADWKDLLVNFDPRDLG